MCLWIAADYGGSELKEGLIEELRKLGHEVVDFGAREYAHKDNYPEYIVTPA